MGKYDILGFNDWARILFINPLTPAEQEYVLAKVRASRDGWGYGRGRIDEPLTFDAYRNWVIRGPGNDIERAETRKILADGVNSGTLPSLVSDADKAIGDRLLPGGWVERLIRAAIDTLTSPETWKALSEINITNWTNWDASDYERAKKAALAFLADPNGPIQKYIKVNSYAITYVIELLTGLTVPRSAIEGIIDGNVTDGDKEALGKLIFSVIDANLLVPPVAEGFLKREAGEAEIRNLDRLFGAQARINVGAMIIEAVEPLVPKKAAGFLKMVRTAVQDTLNLDDAAEEIFQAPIEKLINMGLEAKYNRETKPVDFTDNQAIQAMIGYDLPRETVNKILDNNGLRDDIRETLISMTATNLTESDINEAYQRNLLSIEQVSEQYKQKYFQEPERKIKTDLVKGTRRWQLQTKVVELLGNLYRDGVQTKDACVPYLNALGFENDEQDLWFMQQELERKQRKWITDGNLLKLLDSGQVTMPWAHDYLVLQGMTSDDAWILIANHFKEEALAKIPKAVKNKCLDILDPTKVLIEVLGELAQLANFGTLFDNRAQQFYRCLIEELGKTLQTP